MGENTFVAFATQPGNVTVDGAGQNSPFTAALLNNVEIPGLSISDMMIRVRNETEARPSAGRFHGTSRTCASSSTSPSSRCSTRHC